jgi:hypothetical protein
VQVWRENKPARAGTLSAGRIAVEVHPKGLTVLQFRGVNPRPAFQEKFQDCSSQPLNPTSHDTWQTSLGPVHCAGLCAGRGLTSAYLYLEATERELRSVEIEFQTAKGLQRLPKLAYPFEFSIPLEDSQTEFRFKLRGQTVSGGPLATGEYRVPLH